ncbi:MAG: hypothetical protein PHI41_07270 [Erysipelotrichaceae bacterium]|nr:hypothetical protein [Erysipelotrichaceae bacterium]MDD3810452.1 hypothetical protein [Erysipelotrichaceae bacterium]
MNVFLYGTAFGLLALSVFKDKNRTIMALKKSWRSFENILPQFLGVIVMVGILLSLFDSKAISSLIGASSGWIGVVIAVLAGAVTLIPGFVAFPMAAMLLENGAGYMQIGAFVSALMMVGVITIPVEIKYFGKRLTFARNLLAFLFSFVVALIIGLVV